MKYIKNGTREFFLIKDSGTIMRVLNKEKYSQITVTTNQLSYDEAIYSYNSVEITEQEFREQFEIAKKRMETLEL